MLGRVARSGGVGRSCTTTAAAEGTVTASKTAWKIFYFCGVKHKLT